MFGNFYTLSLIFMSGMAAYSVVLNLSNKSFREQRLVHWLFTAMTLLMVPYLWTLAFMLKSASIGDYILLARLNYVFYLFFIGLFPFFFAQYTAVRLPKTLCFGIYGFFALALILLWTQPYGGIFKQVASLEQVVLPWGEKICRVRGIPTVWPTLGYLCSVVISAFGLYALALKYRRDRKRADRVMMLALLLYQGLVTMGTLYRAGLSDVPPLGPFAYLGMIFFMGLTINHETRQELARHRERLEENGQELSAIYENAPLVMMIVDAGGVVQKINTANNISTLAPGEAIGRRIGEVIRCANAAGGCGAAPPCALCIIADCLRSTVANGEVHREVEARVPAPEGAKGAEQTFLLYSQRLSFRNKPALLICLLDISERRQLRDQVLKVEQQERSRLSRDLHDGVGQTLQAIRLQLQLLGRKAGGDAPLSSQLAAITEELGDAAGELRETAHALHPSYLAAVTLPEALRLRCVRLQQRGVPIVYDFSDQVIALPQHINENLFRIAQELISNAVRHARASRIWASLHRVDEVVRLCVSDDGCGFQGREAAGGANGLENVRERVSLINAVCRIASDSGGTSVTVELPWT